MDEKSPQYISLKLELKLYINERLFAQGHISQELYTRAKIELLKQSKTEHSPYKVHTEKAS